MQVIRQKAVSTALGICAFVTPMIWPTMPVPLGVACYAVAGGLLLFAAVSWWRERRSGGSAFNVHKQKRLAARLKDYAKPNSSAEIRFASLKQMELAETVE